MHMETKPVNRPTAEMMDPESVTAQQRLDIVDEGIRRKYLARLSELDVAEAGRLASLEDDIISNVRLFHIQEMVYQKGESITDKFTTVFNTLSTYNSSVFILIDSNGLQTDYYLGVRNNESDDSMAKRSTVTLADTLKQTLIGHFPGVRIQNEDRRKIMDLSSKISGLDNLASVSVVGTGKLEKGTASEQFVQGLEKLSLAMAGREFTGIILADCQSPSSIQTLRKSYQEMYTTLSQYQKTQFSSSTSKSENRSKSFFEMSGKQKTGMIASAILSVAGAVVGVKAGLPNNGAIGGIIGSQVVGQLNGLISSLAPAEQIGTSTSQSKTTTIENKAVSDLMNQIDYQLKRIDEYDSYGLWNVAGYFLSNDMSAAEIAASNYRSLMNGENSGREVSAINSWRRKDSQSSGNFKNLTTYLSRFVHPQFIYGGNILVDASTSVSGKELGLHLGLPRSTVPGLPVIEHAEFGKEVTSYQLIPQSISTRPEDRMTLGCIFDLGHVTDKIVELNNKSLNMHTFITGSTGSGKSNAVYQMLSELRQDKIPFLVVEPAKGEYKDVFGNLPDVRVYSTNPSIAPLININPFKFPDSIHVLEHIDGLVEIFSVCWPMYDAMPAFFKDAILKSYEAVGWDLGSSVFEGAETEFPDFEVLCEQLDLLISQSDYASDIKSNYRGALLTRVKSLSVGLNKYIFTREQTPYPFLFDENCILDISRVKSTETKALIMGLIVYMLNEYRIDQKSGNNSGLRHITVLEEAHNLLKNTSQGGSDLVGKSVEIITNTIAEIRTYGEGFIIVDQSPSSVDIAAIKNTNTKIVLRTPEANDRIAVGRSVGLTDHQVEEIAKLPSGVAVVYQNNWIAPVLTMIDKANVAEEPYRPRNLQKIPTARTARTQILKALMQPWFPGYKLSPSVLEASLIVLDLSRSQRKKILQKLEEYTLFNGHMLWQTGEINELRRMVLEVLGFRDDDLQSLRTPQQLLQMISQKTNGFSSSQLEQIAAVLTTGQEDENHV